MKRAIFFSGIIFLLAMAVVVLFFFGREETKPIPVEMQVEETDSTPNPDAEISGVRKTVPLDSWTLFSGGSLWINSKTHLERKSDITIPAEYDGKKVKKFDIILNNEEESPYLKNVIIEEGVEEIGSATFIVFTNLETVVIPKSIKKMDKDEFFKVKDKVTLYVQKGSYAEKFAKKKNITYKYGMPS